MRLRFTQSATSFAILAAVLACSCGATINVTIGDIFSSGLMPLSPVSPDSVVVLRDQSDLEDKSYVQLATITASFESLSRWKRSSDAKVVEKMRERAGESGANAMLYPTFERRYNGGFATTICYLISTDKR